MSGETYGGHPYWRIVEPVARRISFGSGNNQKAAIATATDVLGSDTVAYGTIRVR